LRRRYFCVAQASRRYRCRVGAYRRGKLMRRCILTWAGREDHYGGSKTPRSRGRQRAPGRFSVLSFSAARRNRPTCLPLRSRGWRRNINTARVTATASYRLPAAAVRHHERDWLFLCALPTAATRACSVHANYTRYAVHLRIVLSAGSRRSCLRASSLFDRANLVEHGRTTPGRTLPAGRTELRRNHRTTRHCRNPVPERRWQMNGAE